jgi:hypothetical protein
MHGPRLDCSIKSGIIQAVWVHGTCLVFEGFLCHEFKLAGTFGYTPSPDPASRKTPPFGLSPSKTADEVWEAQLGLLHKIWE